MVVLGRGGVLQVHDHRVAVEGRGSAQFGVAALEARDVRTDRRRSVCDMQQPVLHQDACGVGGIEPDDPYAVEGPRGRGR